MGGEEHFIVETEDEEGNNNTNVDVTYVKDMEDVGDDFWGILDSPLKVLQNKNKVA